MSRKQIAVVTVVVILPITLLLARFIGETFGDIPLFLTAGVSITLLLSLYLLKLAIETLLKNYTKDAFVIYLSGGTIITGTRIKREGIRFVLLDGDVVHSAPLTMIERTFTRINGNVKEIDPAKFKEMYLR